MDDLACDHIILCVLHASTNICILSHPAPVCFPGTPPEGDNDDDDESIPLDVDDRCESDISGIADDDDDLSSVSYNIADLPLTVGNVVRSYRHRPNTKMNTFLTVVALVTMFAAIGIGIGHYFGEYIKILQHAFCYVFL